MPEAIAHLMRTPTRRRSLLLLVTGLALAVPGVPFQLLPGLPLTAVGLLAASAALFAAVALPAPSRRVAWLVLAVASTAIALKLTLAAANPGFGLEARYWARATPEGSPERSTDFLFARPDGWTRVDQGLDLQGDEFPVHFFNDAARFNIVGDTRPARGQLAFSGRWDGRLVVQQDGVRRFRLESVGPAHVWVDDVLLLELPPAEGLHAVEASRDFAAGLHRLRVDYQRPEARVPRLGVFWEPVPGAPLQALGTPGSVLLPTADGLGLLPGPALQALAMTADALALASLGAWVLFGLIGLRATPLAAWRRVALAAIPLLFLAYGAALHWEIAGRTTILSGGDDWLTHESSARDILLNGPLMTEGKSEAPPYYAQPLYPYVLAGAHLLAGEGLFGPLVLQFAGLGLVVALSGLLAARLFGWLGGAAAVALTWAFVQQEHVKVARQLLNENLYMPLVMASLLVLVALAQRRRPPPAGVALLTGVLLGLTALARSQFLLFVPLGLLIVGHAWRRGGVRRSIVALGLVAIGTAAAIVPVTARNYVVSGTLTLISSSAGANLWQFHEAPPSLDLSNAAHDPLYDALRLDRETRFTFEYLRRDPVGYLSTWVPFGAHAIGLPGVRRGDGSVYWGLLLTFGLYLAAFGLRRVRVLDVWVVHAFVTSHLLVMMAFASDTYGYRLVVPMYAPIALVAAQVPLVIVARLSRVVPSRAAVAVPTAAIALATVGALGQQARGLVEAWPTREVSYHGLGPPVAHALSRASRVEAEMVYVASADGTPRQFGAGNLSGLRYPEVKWFDPRRSVPAPPAGSEAIYVLSELESKSPESWGLAACLGEPDRFGERKLASEAVVERCFPGDQPGWTRLAARFGNLVAVDAIRAPTSADAGDDAEALLTWTILRRPSQPYRDFVHVLDSNGPQDVMWGNGTAELYPSHEWEPGERILSRLVIPTDPTALPGRYVLALGVAPQTGDAVPLPAAWPGGTGPRAPMGTIDLRLNAHPSPTLDRVVGDMKPLATPKSVGGLELVALRPPGAKARPGDQIRVGLLWRAGQDSPTAAMLRLRLVAPDGDVVQQQDGPLLSGRYPIDALRAGMMLRDEHALMVSPRAPSEELALEWDLLDGNGNVLPLPGSESAATIGHVEIQGRERVFTPPADLGTRQRASFGEKVELLGFRIVPSMCPAGKSFAVRLYWRALAEMQVSYKVFAQVLDDGQQRVIAQRDSEPQEGEAPTPGWIPGEVLEDEYVITIPPGTSPGNYPIQVGLYDPRTGERLGLADGSNRVILSSPVRVVAS